MTKHTTREEGLGTTGVCTLLGSPEKTHQDTHVMDMKNTRLKDCHGLFGVFKECNKSLIIVIGELEKRVSSLASYNWRNI